MAVFHLRVLVDIVTK